MSSNSKDEREMMTVSGEALQLTDYLCDWTHKGLPEGLPAKSETRNLLWF